MQLYYSMPEVQSVHLPVSIEFHVSKVDCSRIAIYTALDTQKLDG